MVLYVSLGGLGIYTTCYYTLLRMSIRGVLYLLCGSLSLDVPMFLQQRRVSFPDQERQYGNAQRTAESREHRAAHSHAGDCVRLCALAADSAGQAQERAAGDEGRATACRYCTGKVQWHACADEAGRAQRVETEFASLLGTCVRWACVRVASTLQCAGTGWITTSPTSSCLSVSVCPHAGQWRLPCAF